MSEELLAPAEVSGQTKIPEATLAQWRWQGLGPKYLKLGAHVRYRRRDLESWLSENERGGAA
jgi:hypothetical protein